VKQSIVIIEANPKSWAIGLEMAVKYAKEGKRVTIVDFSSFKSFSPLSFSRKFFQYHLTYKHRIKVIKVKDKSLAMIPPNLDNLKSLDDIKNIELYGVHVGEVLLTQLFELYGTSRIELEDLRLNDLIKELDFINRILSSIINIPHFLLQFTSELVVFNGRKTISALCVQLARERGIKTRISERASSSQKYLVYDVSPHTNSEWWDNINKFRLRVAKKLVPIDNELVSNYIKQKSAGFDPINSVKWRDYMDPLKPIDLPSKSYVVFFSVSTAEKSPVPEFDTIAGFSNQFTALDALIHEASELGIHVVIRRHPNSIGKDGVDRETTFWKLYKQNLNLTYIGPLETIDSYKLAKGAVSCFTWRSTIGFDTLSLGIPTYSLGPSKWAFHDSVRAWDKHSIRIRLKNPALPSEPIVFVYASYMSHFGDKLTILDSVERWGFYFNSGRKKQNFFLQRTLGKLRG
jgi:hypothetical protein